MSEPRDLRLNESLDLKLETLVVHSVNTGVPHAVTFVAELPKTATGKVQKYVLRGGKAAITRQ